MLASDAASALLEAVGLVQAKNNLELAAANLQSQAAQLEAEGAAADAPGQGLLPAAEGREAEEHADRELTAAGGDDRGTDTRLVALQNGLNATRWNPARLAPDINKPGTRRSSR